MKKRFGKLKKTWYKKALRMKYSNQSFMSSILTYGILLLLLFYIGQVGILTEKQNDYLAIWIRLLISLISANIIGILLFKIKKMVKYAVIIPYIRGLLFLFFPSFMFGILADEIMYYPIQCLIILFVSIFNFFYQIFMVNFVAKLKDYTTKQYVIHAIPMVILLPALILMFIGGSKESPTIMGGGVLFLMSVIGAFLFPQFVRIIQYWEEPKTPKSRYENVLNKLE